ncbi:hypothetical protein BJY04DRAFT_188020 [Aspergillus karnatakaensis]|uniref:uncharacterized protein n=1 Tax=Aspergillus karnatakaensis TaxID=1810916 RepID=UPI003CCDB35D
MEVASQEDRALVTIGRAVAARFFTLSEQIDGTYRRAFVNEQQRYEIWASTLGLYHTGHSSLDYRFRDSPPLFEYTFTLLEDVNNCLIALASITDNTTERATACENVSAAEGISMSDNESEEDLSSYETALLETEYITTISITVDRLYELSFKIRNPRMRTGLSRALRYTEIDPSTGIDPIEHYRLTDLLYMKEAFRSWGRVLDVDSHFLVHRLATANTHRRQQFRYWERRRLKYDYYYHRAKIPEAQEPTNLRIPQEGSVAPSEPSTATTLDMAKLNEYATSVISTDSYTMIASDDVENLNLPSPPALKDSQKEAECPLCFIICSRTILHNPTWSKHVMRDLRPYVCTFEDCRNPDQQYEFLTEWVAHESSNHGVQLKSNRTCPLCPQSSIDVYHIARHLRKISIFSLPEIEAKEDAAADEDASLGTSNEDASSFEKGSTDRGSGSIADWEDNNRFAHFINDNGRLVTLGIFPTEFLEADIIRDIRAEFSIDSGTTIQFLDASGYPVMIDYDSIHNNMQIFVSVLSNEETDAVDQADAEPSDLNHSQESATPATSRPITFGHPYHLSSQNLLDRRYAVPPQGYFQAGKVFSILWHENEGAKPAPQTDAGPTYVGRFGEPIYSIIGHFVVVKPLEKVSWCFIITTYNGRGLAKQGIDPSKHAVIYMSNTDPMVAANEPPMPKEPIGVDPDRPDEGLHHMSRINFGEMYTVEHNVKILPIGRISKDSMPRFIEYASEELTL